MAAMGDVTMLLKIYSVKTVKVALAKSIPPLLIVTAEGSVNSSGWKDGQLSPRVYIRPPEDGIQDFDFLARPPAGFVRPVVTDISAEDVYGRMPGWLKGIRVHSANNAVEVAVTNPSSVTIAPWASVADGADYSAMGDVNVGSAKHALGGDEPFPWFTADSLIGK